MRLPVDESTGPWVAKWLREQGHEVFSIYEQARGLDDDAIIEKAFAKSWILITNDKDFGDKIFRDKKPHKGIVLLRLDDERSVIKIEVLQRLLQNYPDKLDDQFTVVTEKNVRFVKL